jgi:hypothetical protein
MAKIATAGDDIGDADDGDDGDDGWATGGMVPPPRGYAKGGIAGIFNQAINPKAFGKANLEQLKGGNIDPRHREPVE